MSALGLRIGAWQARGDGAGIRDYVQDGLMLHYDGKQPTRDGSAPVATWEDWSLNGWDTIGAIGNGHPIYDPQQLGWHFAPMDTGFVAPNPVGYAWLRPGWTVDAAATITSPTTQQNVILEIADVLDPNPNTAPKARFQDHFGNLLLGWYASQISAAADAPIPRGLASVAITYSPGLISYYIDGALMDTRAATLALAGVNNMGVSIGRHYVSGGSPMLTGALHGMRLYDHALTGTEVAHNAAIDALRFGAGA